MRGGVGVLVGRGIVWVVMLLVDEHIGLILGSTMDVVLPEVML